MTSREKKDCIKLEKRLNAVYWQLCEATSDLDLSIVAAEIEAIQFALACIRGYKGD